MRTLRILLLGVVPNFLFAATGPGEGQGIQAKNVVTVSDRLVTSGQPTSNSLATLSKQGFQAVIYLAPPTVSNAVSNEPDLIRGQGMDYINIPIEWTHPTEAHFHAFVAAMKQFQGRKVLVHCQANMRASAMTFLYRVIIEGENPARAYEFVTKVWSPDGPWKTLIESQLLKSKIAFTLP